MQFYTFISDQQVRSMYYISMQRYIYMFINPHVHQPAQTMLREIYMIFAPLWIMYRKWAQNDVCVCVLGRGGSNGHFTSVFEIKTTEKISIFAMAPFCALHKQEAC